MYSFFFLNNPPTPEIYTLPLHDALPICHKGPHPPQPHPRPYGRRHLSTHLNLTPEGASPDLYSIALYFPSSGACLHLTHGLRSEERRVGEECRSRWSPYH